MSVVAISQALGSSGNDVGRQLAQALGYEFADREVISATHDLQRRPKLGKNSPMTASARRPRQPCGQTR